MEICDWLARARSLGPAGLAGASLRQSLPPLPKRLKSADWQSALLPPVTLWEAIGDLPPLAAGEGAEEADYDLRRRQSQLARYGGRYLKRVLQIHRALRLTAHVARPHSDRGLMTIAPDLTARIAPAIKTTKPKEPAGLAWLVAFDGKPLRPPRRFRPDPELLARHMERFLR